MPFLSVRDLTLYYEIHGAGPPLLFLNGSGGDLRNPRSGRATVAPLAAICTVLAYDQRGLGQTSKPDGPYTMADYAADADALLQGFGWDSCAVFGVSFGGMVAQEFSIRFPHRVRRLVLVGTSSGGAGGASVPQHEWLDLPVAERVARTLATFDTRQDAAWQAAHPEMVEAMVRQLSQPPPWDDDPRRDLGFRLQMLARKDHDTFDRLPSVTAPTLICGGVYDGVAPPSNQYAMARQIPNARLELFEGGHGFLGQDPRAYAVIRAFLQEEP